MHRPVLAVEVLELLAVRPGGTYIDATVGGGGHARMILERMGSEGRLLALDRDPSALERARAQLGVGAPRCLFAHGNFAAVAELAASVAMRDVDGILMDVGMSSDQVDRAERGFSFQRDGPLDMRFDPGQTVTAEALVNGLREDELARLLRTYGEEPAAGRIARAIVRAREQTPIKRTVQLAELVAKAKGGRYCRIHPATQTFQALRIAVNDELASLDLGLEAALGLLRTGGRLAVISFHSLEDRLVKRCLVAHAGREEALEGGGSRRIGREPAVKILTKKPVVASADEQRDNPRARSARLRAAERTA